MIYILIYKSKYNISREKNIKQKKNIYKWYKSRNIQI